MTQRETSIMVAVPGTQAGATHRTFDEARYLREVHWPVKEFLTATGDTCPVLIFFLVGPDAQYEEGVAIPLPEQNEGCGCPSYLAAERHLYQEVRRGLVTLMCLTGDDAEHCGEAVSRYMKAHGVDDRRIFSPVRLSDLTLELTGVVS